MLVYLLDGREGKGGSKREMGGREMEWGSFFCAIA